MKKILIVDDEADILAIMSYRLKKMGYEVFLAPNGQDDLDQARSIKPDLIFLDLRLPVLSGYEVCKILKNDEELKKIPIVFFTASLPINVAEKMKEFQADDYIIKPFEPKDLIEKVKKYLG